jgi:hypothetical protein
MRRHIAVFSLAFLLSGAGACFGQGTTMRYTFRGLATGTMGAQPITNAAFTVTGTASTSSIHPLPHSDLLIVTNPTCTVAGVGTVTITDGVTFAVAGGGTIVGLLDQLGYTMFLGTAPGGTTVSLATPQSLIPITVTGTWDPSLTAVSTTGAATSLKFDTVSSLTFAAEVDGSTPATPVPPSVLLAGIGVLGLGARQFWKYRRI